MLECRFKHSNGMLDIIFSKLQSLDQTLIQRFTDYQQLQLIIISINKASNLGSCKIYVYRAPFLSLKAFEVISTYNIKYLPTMQFFEMTKLAL